MTTFTPIDCQFPIITYHGDQPEQWGQSHGEQFRHAINQLAEIRRELMLEKNPALANELDSLALAQWQSTVAQAPLVAKEMEGIRQGAGLSLTQLVILNNYTDFRDITLPDEGCSTVAGLKKGFSLAGQTWDMHSSSKNYLCLLHVPATKEVPESLIFSLVGCVGLMGITSNNLFVGVNNINTTGARPGIIWPALVRQLLLAKSFQEMTTSLSNLKVTSGHNYLLSSPDNAQHWEVTPEVTDKLELLGHASPGISFHTNHCLGQQVKKLEMSDSLSSTTFGRYQLLQKKLPAVDSLDSLYSVLTNHDEYPKSICSHFQSNTTDPSQTCGGGIVDWNSGNIVFWRGCPVHDRHFIKREFQLSNGHFQRNWPYFVTWTAQSQATQMALLETHDHSFKLTSGQTVQDLSSLSLQASFGLRPQFVMDAVTQQVQTMPITPIKSEYALKTQATQKLLHLIEGPNPSGKIFYTVSGAESVENALKMSRHMTGKSMILARTRSYHGATMGALAVTGDWRNREHLLPREWTVRLPEPNEDVDGSLTIALIKKTGPEKIAALCIETISGANGAETYAPAWWKNVPSELRRLGIKLILDEVVCGFGRTCKPFGLHHFGVSPDFITMAKAISAGVIPFGAVWASKEVANYYQDHLLSAGLTQYANPAGLAAMNAVIDYLHSDHYQANAKSLFTIHEKFHTELRSMDLVKTTRLHGHLMAIELQQPINWGIFLQQGLYFISKDNMAVLAPALNYSPTELQAGYGRFLEILRKGQFA